MSRNLKVMFVGLLATCSFTVTARSDEEVVALGTLPKAVIAAVKAKFPDAALARAGREEEGGAVIFEVTIQSQGRRFDVAVTAEGKVLEIEKTIAVKDLPKPVAEALQQTLPKATVRKAEEVTKGERVFYELLVVAADRKWTELVFDPTGRVVEREDKTPDTEEELAPDKLPAAVLEAVKKKYPNSEVIDAAKETEDDETFYEATLKLATGPVDVLVAPNGVVVEIERTIAAGELPKAVRDAVARRFPKTRIKKAEEKTEGEVVTYEVVLIGDDNKTLEVEFDKSGQIQATETGEEAEK